MKSNTKFCHFTTLDAARSILSSGYFILSKYNHMNDLSESGKHIKDQNRVFVLSFCNSEALNIPLFYIYSGIDGKGCRIQFTEAKINEIIKTATINYVNKHNKIINKNVPHSHCKIIGDWIYYIASNGYCEHKTLGKISYDSLINAEQQLSNDCRHLFIKNPIWKYENEFRIIVVFDEEVPYDRIAMNFKIKNNDRGITVKFGPETSSEEFEQLSQEFYEYGVSKCLRSSEDAIKMGLVEKNKWLMK